MLKRNEFTSISAGKLEHEKLDELLGSRPCDRVGFKGLGFFSIRNSDRRNLQVDQLLQVKRSR